MSDEHISSKRRRDFLDGSYTVGLLTVAILSGYLLLSPSVETARATTVARPVPVPTPGPVSDYVGRPVDVMAMKDGSILVSDDWNGAVWRVSYGNARTAGAR